MMVLKGAPNRVVQKRKRVLGNRTKVVALFRFDKEGYAEIDETKFDKTDLVKIFNAFGITEAITQVPVEEVEEVDVDSMSYNELRKYGKTLGIGNTSIRKEELLEKIKEVI